MEWRYIWDVQDIQDDFEYMLVKHQTVTDNPSRGICINNIEKKNIFKIETGYNPKVITPETIRLLGKTGSRITKDKNGEMRPSNKSPDKY